MAHTRMMGEDDHSALLVLQQAYTNPQLLDEYAAVQAQVAAAAASSYKSHHHHDHDNPHMLPAIVSPASLMSDVANSNLTDELEAIGKNPSSKRSQITAVADPAPLLAQVDSSILEPSQSASISPLAVSPSANPHKPLRRWLFDFPTSLDRFFWTMDTKVTQFIQRPLATVGGQTTLIEEEIMEANELASQARLEMAVSNHDRLPISPTNNRMRRIISHSTASTEPLRKSMAVTGTNKVLVFLALLYTSLTTIELGVFFPLFLFMSGWDEIGTLTLLVNSFAAVFSQVFKRFVWRPRPWMCGRAITVKRDKTSSFPSRAVVCAVVYAYGFSHLFYPPHSVPLSFEFGLILAFAVGAGVSRIFVGAHFASDCIAGFVLGATFCSIGSGFNRLFEGSCGGCYARLQPNCYAETLAQELDFHGFLRANMLTMGLTSGLSIIVVGLAMSSPLHFWTKCTSIFGILFPCFAFRLVLLCPSHNTEGLALLRVNDRPAAFIVQSLLVASGLLIFTKLLSKLTVLETTVQLTAESQSSDESPFSHRDTIDDSYRSLTASTLESSLIEPNHTNDDPLHPSESISTTSQSVTFGLGHTAASSKHFLQFASIKTMAWNLSIYFIAYSTVFLVLMVWRILYASKEFPPN